MKNRLLASVSMLALIVAGCNADSGDNLGMNNDTEVVLNDNDSNLSDENLTAEERLDRLEDNDNNPNTRTP